MAETKMGDRNGSPIFSGSAGKGDTPQCFPAWCSALELQTFLYHREKVVLIELDRVWLRLSAA